MENAAAVFLVDDDPGVVQSLAWLLQSEGIEVEAYSSAREFLESYDDRRPGCVVLDLRLPDLDGLAVQQRLAARGERPPIIFLTGHGNVASCVRAMKAGAMDFLEKPVNDEVFLELVRRAIESDRARRRLEANRPELKSRLKRLTPREREVMHLLFAGKTPKSIAARLGISIQTVSKHRASVLKKMEVGGEAELARLLMGYPLDFSRQPLCGLASGSARCRW